MAVDLPAVTGVAKDMKEPLLLLSPFVFPPLISPLPSLMGLLPSPVSCRQTDVAHMFEIFFLTYAWV